MKFAASLALLIAAWWPNAFGHTEHEAPGAAARAQLGKVHFPTSCSAAVAADFDTSVALLHSFWVKDAIEGFNHVLKRDPACAIAYWGIAMSLQQNPLTGQEPTAEARREALEALAKARALGARTQRERDYLAAIELIYKDADKFAFRERRLAYEKAMQALAARYAEDTEAQIFYALALSMTADLADKTYSNQLKAAQILEPLFSAQPEHPGVAHYLVHAYDYPPIAPRGVEAARRYARIAPANPHALHMPSHIFTHLGSWQESIDTNARSAAAAEAEKNGQEQAHAMDYQVYAYLQLGRDSEARRLVEASQKITTFNPAVFIGPYGIAAMPARYVIERQAWSEATALVPHESRFAHTRALTHFARGLGFARSGNALAAGEEAGRLAQLRDTLREQKIDYWANQVEVQRLAVAAWASLAQGNSDEAMRSMRAAADLEDSMQKHIVTPAPLVPARELLGEMLLQLERPGEALFAFEAAAKREPNRFRNLYGAGRAAAAAGEHDKATAYFRRLAALAGDAGDARPELRQARAYLARR